MSKVFEIGISDNRKNKIKKVQFVSAVAGKGLLNDRFYKNENEKSCQLTLIEKENIDNFNSLLDTNIPYIDFRRNIVTTGISLNGLVGNEIFIGQVKLRVHELCEPCKHLQQMLNQNDLVKNLIHKAGLRCEILTDGKISVNDEITF